jgi:hypothetical protein
VCSAGAWVVACAACGEVASEAEARGFAREQYADDPVSVREQPLSCATAPWLSTHFGDLVIHDQAEADAVSCITRILGSLTIADSDAFAIALPQLRTVIGDVNIVYSSDTGPAPCDGCQVRTVSLPQLTRIVGDVDLTYPGANGGFYSAVQDLGLPALTTLVGDLHVAIDNFGANLKGLSSLTRLDGSFSLWVRTGDVAGGAFLGSLRLVTGDVRFLDGGNTFYLLNSLESVLGTFAIDGLLLITSMDNFTSLRTVGRNVELHDMFIGGPDDGTRVLPALSFVGGYLDLRAVSITGATHDFVVAQPDVRLFGLRMVETDFATFESFDPQLFPFGHVDLRDNPEMCPDSASAFIAAQRAQGYFGLATESGNGVSATCP